MKSIIARRVVLALALAMTAVTASGCAYWELGLYDDDCGGWGGHHHGGHHGGHRGGGHCR